MDPLRIIIAILPPPLSIFLQEGFRKNFWFNILLMPLGYIPASFTPFGSPRSDECTARPHRN